MAMTFFESLRLNAKRFPDKIAIHFNESSISYAGLLEKTNRLRNSLIKLGYHSEDKIAILAVNHLDYMVAYHAITSINAIPAPVNYRLTDDDFIYIVKNADSKGLFLGRDYFDKADLFEPLLDHIIFMDCDEKPVETKKKRHSMSTLIEQADDKINDFVVSGTTVILHTSGTTGKPKGSVRSRFGMEERAIDQGFQSQDNTLCCLPVCLSAGFVYSMLPLYLGATIYLQESFDEDDALRLIEEEKINSAMLFPAMLERMTTSDRFASCDTSSMHVIQSGAGFLHPELRKTVLEKFGPILRIYAASTEVGPYANLIGEAVAKYTEGNCVGQPFFGVDLKILDDDGNELGVGEIGEICCRSNSQYDGYYKDEAQTEETRRGDYLTVGDLGYINEHGMLFFAGRKRDIIKTGGINVFAPEIEEELEHHQAIQEAACVGLPDRKWVELICAVIVKKPGITLTEDDVINFAGERLAKYKKPRVVVFIDEIPKNLTGRVLKTELLETVQTMLEKQSTES